MAVREIYRSRRRGWVRNEQSTQLTKSDHCILCRSSKRRIILLGVLAVGLMSNIYFVIADIFQEGEDDRSNFSYHHGEML